MNFSSPKMIFILIKFKVHEYIFIKEISIYQLNFFLII